MTDSRATSTAPSITRLADYEVYPFAIDSVNLTFDKFEKMKQNN